jgi:hypothetical protein
MKVDETSTCLLRLHLPRLPDAKTKKEASPAIKPTKDMSRVDIDSVEDRYRSSLPTENEEQQAKPQAKPRIATNLLPYTLGDRLVHFRLQRQFTDLNE